MTKLATEKPKKDWRSKPRKPAALKKSRTISVRVSPSEFSAIKANAKAAGLPLNDFVRGRCLSETPEGT